MKKTSLVLAVMLSILSVYPAAARGGFGGFSGGGHSFGGFSGGAGRSFGGFSGGGGHSFSGFGGGGDRSFSGGSFGRSAGQGFGGRDMSSNFGGGFNSAGRAGNIGNGGFRNDGGFGGGGAATRPSGGGDWGNHGGGSGNWGNHGDGGWGNHGDGGWGNHGDGGWGNHGNGGWANHPDQPISGNHPADGGWGNASHWNNNSNHFNQFNQNNWNSSSVRNSFNSYNNVNFNHYGGYGGYGHGYGYGAYGYGGYHGAWWGYPGGWYCPGWSSATAWTMMGVSTLTSFLGIAALAESGGGKHSNNNNPTSVTNVSYNGGNVYINGAAAGTEQDYYNQALALAGQGSTYATVNEQDPNATTTADQWQPLGVFSLVQKGQSQSSMLLQLAINKQGIVRGNYFNQLTSESQEVYGSLNKQTQRISFTIGQNNQTVFDTSLVDITKDDAPCLVHYSATNTEGMMLVRVQQPKGASAASTGGPSS